MLLTPCEQFLVPIWHHILLHKICLAHCTLESVFVAALSAPTYTPYNAAGAACHVLLKPPIPAPSLKGLQRVYLGSVLIHYRSSCICKVSRIAQPRSLSSRYTYLEGRSRRYEGTREVGIILYGSEEAMKARCLLVRAFLRRTDNRIIDWLHWRRLAQNPGRGFLCGPSEMHCEPQRFMALISFSTLSPSTEPRDGDYRAKDPVTVRRTMTSQKIGEKCVLIRNTSSITSSARCPDLC